VLKEFKSFILKGNIITIAIGLVLAAAFSDVVTSFVANFITPIVGSMAENGIGDVLAIPLRNDNKIRVGLFINACINFAAIAAALFFLVVKPLNKMGYTVDTESQ
jgi:large conductance mechanosensitive channel